MLPFVPGERGRYGLSGGKKRLFFYLEIQRAKQKSEEAILLQILQRIFLVYYVPYIKSLPDELWVV